MITFVYITYACLVFASLLCLYRIGTGPTAPDRAVAIDILGTLLVGFCAVLGLESGMDYYLNVAIAWALLSFIGTIALAKFLEGKGFDE